MLRFIVRLRRVALSGWTRQSLSTLQTVLTNFGKDNGYLLAAALSFYGAFALFPLLLGLVALLSAIVPPTRAQALVLHYAGRLLGTQTSFVTTTLTGIRDARGTIGAVSALLLVWSARAGFQNLATALNIIFGFPGPQGLLAQIRGQIKAVGFAFGSGALIAVLAALYWGIAFLVRT
ncbi:MAG: YihY/virulence factor BrkB family protein, partial [Cyanobacteria bacterium REEB65]|nr:YihY/virulence factor BrkB family protein [Cyanobacteria bacterium REEB65]